MTREYVAAFPVLDEDVPISRLLDEAQLALSDLLEADDLVQVGRFTWDTYEPSEGPIQLMLTVPVFELEPA